MRQIETILLAGITVNLVWVEGAHGCFGVLVFGEYTAFLVKQNNYRDSKGIYVSVS